MSAFLAALGILVTLVLGFILGWRRAVKVCAKVAMPIILAQGMRAELAIKMLGALKNAHPQDFEDPEAKELMGMLDKLQEAVAPKKKAA